MSRVGKKPIIIPAGVTVAIEGDTVKVKGPKGELSYTLHPAIGIEKKEDVLELKIVDKNNKHANELWGTNRQMVANMLAGVLAGYSKELEINGVGYKAELKGDKLILAVGYSHPVEFGLPAGVAAKVEKNVITLESIDKYLLGETAAKVRKIKKPEVYKGKGIKYKTEVVRRKAGKQVKSAA